MRRVRATWAATNSIRARVFDGRRTLPEIATRRGGFMGHLWVEDGKEEDRRRPEATARRLE
jgi:hypothetical protein